MQVKFKKLHPNAVIPSYAHKSGDAGLDITAISAEAVVRHSWHGDSVYMKYGTGLAVEIPEGYVGLIFPRSSIAKKTLMLSNAVGVVDNNYRGELFFFFTLTEARDNIYDIGDRIGQLVIMPYPTIEPVEAKELSETNRGSGSYGSTGN